jgi:hypothetical protein
MMDDAEVETWARALESNPTFVGNSMQGILQSLETRREAALALNDYLLTRADI